MKRTHIFDYFVPSISVNANHKPGHRAYCKLCKAWCDIDGKIYEKPEDNPIYFEDCPKRISVKISNIIKIINS